MNITQFESLKRADLAVITNIEPRIETLADNFFIKHKTTDHDTQEELNALLRRSEKGTTSLNQNHQYNTTGMQKSAITAPNCNNILEIVLSIMKLNPEEFQFASSIIKKDVNFILTNLKFAYQFNFIGKKLYENERVMLAMCALPNADFSLVGAGLRDNKAFVLEILSHKSVPNHIMRHLGERLHVDKEIAKRLLSKNGLDLQYANPILRASIGIVRCAIANNPTALLFADDKIRNNAVIISNYIYVDKIDLKNQLAGLTPVVILGVLQRLTLNMCFNKTPNESKVAIQCKLDEPEN